jgi:hypothetical protein
MRFMDILLAFPGIFLAIAIIAVLGPGLLNLMLAAGIYSVPQFARIGAAHPEPEGKEFERPGPREATNILFRSPAAQLMAPCSRPPCAWRPSCLRRRA